MLKLLTRISLGALLAGTLLLGALSAISTRLAAADTAGTVHFMRLADSSFDQFTSSPTVATQEWVRGHIWRMVVWSPYFDGKTGWYPNGWVYDDSYAIYRGSAQAGAHPEWILRDAAGNPLYIPSGCSGGTCPQYAGDIGNPAYRQAWIEGLKAEIARGYRGVFIDDVNMSMRVSNGNEESVAPIDRATGKPMTNEAWRAYMARFMQEVRAQLPNIEIAHNVIWYADEHAGTTNANIRAEIEAANYIFLERGANDSGLTGGEGQWSLNALLSYVDEVHALGRGVVMDGTSSEPQGLSYNLASYFLISDGNDAVSGNDQTPENWWSGWSVNLGEATGPRRTWEHLLRRDFSGGMVLVNEPGEPTKTVSLPTPMQNAEGATVSSVTLPAASGAILRGTPPASTPPSEGPAMERPSENSTSGGDAASGGSSTGGWSTGGSSPSVSSSGVSSGSGSTRGRDSTASAGSGSSGGSSFAGSGTAPSPTQGSPRHRTHRSHNREARAARSERRGSSRRGGRRHAGHRVGPRAH